MDGVKLIKYDFEKYGKAAERKRLIDRWTREVESQPRRSATTKAMLPADIVFLGRKPQFAELIRRPRRRGPPGLEFFGSTSLLSHG